MSRSIFSQRPLWHRIAFLVLAPTMLIIVLAFVWECLIKGGPDSVHWGVILLIAGLVVGMSLDRLLSRK